MRLSRWMTLIGAVVALGCLKVSQRNAIFLRGYAVGERLGRVHTQETDVSWLNAQVIGLASPGRLARVAQERRLKLVAWSTLSPERTVAAVQAAEGGAVTDRAGSAMPRLDHVAALDAEAGVGAEDTAD